MGKLLQIGKDAAGGLADVWKRISGRQCAGIGAFCTYWRRMLPFLYILPLDASDKSRWPRCKSLIFRHGYCQLSPLARAYLAAVRAGQITEDSPELQLEDMALAIVQMRVGRISADFLRVVAALCEVAAEMKEKKE